MKPAPENESSEQDPAVPEPAGNRAGDPLDQELEDFDPSGEEDPEAGEPLSPPKARKSAEGESAPGSGVSRTDLVWMGILALVVLAIGIFGYSIFRSNIHTASRADAVDFPVKGTRVVIKKAETYWRKPEEDTGARWDAYLVPAAEITLKSGEGTGFLRCLFENDRGDYIGDPVTLDFADGRFTDSGSERATIGGTDGFRNEGDYNVYLTEELKSWFLNVLEGPAADGERLQRIARIRISPKRR